MLGGSTAKLPKQQRKKNLRGPFNLNIENFFQAAASGEDGLVGRGIDSSKKDPISLLFNSVPSNFITNQI